MSSVFLHLSNQNENNGISRPRFATTFFMFLAKNLYSDFNQNILASLIAYHFLGFLILILVPCQLSKEQALLILP